MICGGCIKQSAVVTAGNLGDLTPGILLACWAGAIGGDSAPIAADLSGPALQTDPGVKPGRKTYYGAAWVRACCIAIDTALSRSAGKVISSFSPPCLACTRSSRTPNRS